MIGTYIEGRNGLNLKLVKYEDRPDAADLKSDDIYRLEDVFSVMDGSWELTPGKKYSIDQWAKVKYWDGDKWSSTGDHNFHIMVLDKAGNPMMGKGILFRQNDWHWERSNLKDASPKGDADVVLSNSYVPERGELGSWIGTAVGRSDALVGVDMPANHHVTVFYVLRATAATTPPPPPPTPADSTLTFQQALIVAQAAGTRAPAMIRKRVDELLALDKAMDETKSVSSE
jgi:hypothetical protein